MPVIESSNALDYPAVHILTLGCPKNEVDSDRMRGLIQASSYRYTGDLDASDIAIVNTCSFIQSATEESIATVLDLTDWRNARPGRRIVVTGCMPSRYGAELEDELAEADALVPVAEEQNLLGILDGLTGMTSMAGSEVSGVRDMSLLRTESGPYAYLQVSDGCSKCCSYCTIPSIRGPYRSRPLEELVREAELLVSRGVKELILIGQDTSAWGRDLEGDERLPELVRAISAVDEVGWVRLMYVQPEGISDSLLDAMAESPQVCAYLDMPLQHSVSRILRAMHRTGSADDFLKLIDRIRAKLPDAVLRTTLIAGFPGETEDDIAALEAFLESAGFDYVGVFPYSPEEGTPAADLPELPEEDVRLARAQRIRDKADGISVAKHERLVGKTIEVLSEGVDEEGDSVGRWRGQAPEVDGVVFLDSELPEGTMTLTRIDDAFGYDFEGTVI